MFREGMDMSRNNSSSRTTGDSAEDGGRHLAQDSGEGAGQVSETVTREHTANSNQVRHEPIKSSRHSEDEEVPPHDPEDE
jgi:hypothetical protein